MSSYILIGVINLRGLLLTTKDHYCAASQTNTNVNLLFVSDRLYRYIAFACRSDFATSDQFVG